LTVNPEQLKFLRNKIVEFLKSESATGEFAVEFADALHKKLLRFFPSATAEILAAGYVGSLCTLEVLFQKLGLIVEFNGGDKRC
jgi:predicted membrane protein